MPRLGPPPPGTWRVYLGLSLFAWALLLPASAMPWRWLPTGAGWENGAHAINLHWLVHQWGLLEVSHSRMLYYPSGVDWLTSCGFPLDALISWPLVWLLGWPAGFTLFLVLMLWAAGASMAWLAARWWRSAPAALVAGVAYQCSGALLWELASGRPSSVFGAVLLPLALGLLARGMLTHRWRDGLLAGAVAGLAVIPYWFSGIWLALGFMVLALLALLERRLPWKTCLAGGLGAVLVAGLPAAYAWINLDLIPGVAMGASDQVYHQGEVLTLLGWIQAHNGLFSPGAVHGVRLLAPLIIGLVLLAVVGHRVRRWAAPLLWIAVGGVIALGPWLQLRGGPAVPGPFLAWLDLPLLQRFWWPQRALLLAAPAVALLAGGGALRLLSLFAHGGAGRRLGYNGTLPEDRFLGARSEPGHLAASERRP